MAGVGRVGVIVPAAGGHLRSLALLTVALQREGKRVVFVSADRPYQSLTRLLAEHGVSVDRLHVVDAVSSLNGAAPMTRPANATFLPSPTMLEMLAMRVEQAALRQGEGAHVILDSLDTLCLYNGAHPVQEFAHYLANRLRAQGISGDLVARDGPVGKQMQGLVASFTDGIQSLPHEVHP